MPDPRDQPAAQPPKMADELFLIRVTGKGLTFKRRIPGWLAGWLIRACIASDPNKGSK
jgi:hypothetical protein